QQSVHVIWYRPAILPAPRHQMRSELQLSLNGAPEDSPKDRFSCLILRLNNLDEPLNEGRSGVRRRTSGLVIAFPPSPTEQTKRVPTRAEPGPTTRIFRKSSSVRCRTEAVQQGGQSSTSSWSARSIIVASSSFHHRSGFFL